MSVGAPSVPAYNLPEITPAQHLSSQSNGNTTNVVVNVLKEVVSEVASSAKVLYPPMIQTYRKLVGDAADTMSDFCAYKKNEHYYSIERINELRKRNMTEHGLNAILIERSKFREQEKKIIKEFDPDCEMIIPEDIEQFRGLRSDVYSKACGCFGKKIDMNNWALINFVTKFEIPVKVVGAGIAV